MTLIDAPPRGEPANLQNPSQDIDADRAHCDEQAPHRRPNWVRRILVLTGFLIGLTAFGILAVTPDGTGFMQPVDSRLSAALHVAMWQPTTWSTAIASPGLIAAGALITVILLWQPHDSRRRRWSPITVTLCTGLAAAVVGFLVARPGPGHLGDLSAANAASFPSIGAAMATGLALTMLRTRFPARRHAFVVPLAALAVAVPVLLRLATAASWPLDEAAGIFVGAAVANRVLRPEPCTAQRRRPRQGHVRLLACFAVVACSVPVGLSYVSTLTEPGSAPFDQRSIEWLRDHGLSQLVDRGESWWLWRHLPSPTATISELPPPPVHLTAARSSLPATIAATLHPALPGEGEWAVAATDPSGIAQVATSYFRPDPSHPSLVAGVAWINASTTHVSMIAGTRQPGGGAGPAGGRVPDELLPTLLAAFNSGYKMSDTPGGALIEGHMTRRMVDGLATLAINANGIATVGEWGTTLTADQGYTSIRQNLHLMVVDATVVDGVATNAGGRWGTVRNTLPTWRSGLGVTVDGDLVYVAGNNLTLGVLANGLVRAGAVTAMELDIHKGMVTFNLFTHRPELAGHKLLPDMTRPANRYLTTDWRDFIVVTAA